jgi:hypothetical protein
MVGTIGFWCPVGAPSRIEVCSLYVRPKYRRQGWAGCMLSALRDVAFAVGFERTTLESEWNNQVGLKFYLSQGMWVRKWKDGIQLYFDRTMPAWTLDVAGARAEFRAEGHVLGVAHNNGDRLCWEPGDESTSALAAEVESTVALKLALMGWPLICDNNEWQALVDRGWCEGGGPTELAFRLRFYEMEIKARGWKLPMPRNPSLASLPRIVSVARQNDQFVVELSDESIHNVSLDHLLYWSRQKFSLGDVAIDYDVDAIVATLEPGGQHYFSVEQIIRRRDD